MTKFTYKINKDLSFTGFRDGKKVYKSRQFRLLVQAEGEANKWLQQVTDEKQAEGVSLEVHDLTVDTDSIIRRMTNG